MDDDITSIYELLDAIDAVIRAAQTEPKKHGPGHTRRAERK